MSRPSNDSRFAGSIPQLYERLMVPMLFEPYAVDLAERAAIVAPRQVLETAAGTGALTRELARSLAASAEIVATDLNAPMIERAAEIGTDRPVRWQAADAMRLPFDDASFDLVVCQFGAMFFPDKSLAFAEVRRVLRPGGTWLFNVWDRIETNDFAQVVSQALAAVFPHDPPLFLERTPHGYSDTATIADDLARAGFTESPSFEAVERLSRAASPSIPATALCQGSPLRAEIEARGAPGLDEATARVAAALEQRFGAGPIEGRMRAHVVAVRQL